MDNLKDKNCKNCRFYLKHYIKKSTGFSQVEFGHCTNCESNIKNRLKFRQDCKYWQPAENQINECKEKSISYLKYLAKQLEAVCEVLLDESD